MSATRLGVSERRACRVLGQHRSAQRHIPRGRDDEDRLVADMIELARRYGRYGYRRIAALLRDAGWQVNDKRVERLWRREGLKVPGKQPKRGRLWLNDGSCVRLRDELLNGEIFYTLKEAQVLIESLAAPLQRHTPTQQPGIPAAGPGNDRHAKLAARLRSAPPTIQLGRETVNALCSIRETVGAVWPSPPRDTLWADG